MITIYFLRHAQTVYNATQTTIGGRSNHIELSEEGVRQAEEAAEWFAQSELYFDQVFCSSAVRARHTLATITKQHQLTERDILYTDCLNEVSQGDWEGKQRSDILTPEILTKIVEESPYFKAPNGESHKEAEIRMTDFVNKEITTRYESGTFLLVGHGLSFKCFLEGILGLNPKMTYKLGVDNVSLSRLRYEKERGWFLDFLNRKISGI